MGPPHGADPGAWGCRGRRAWLLRKLDSLEGAARVAYAESEKMYSNSSPLSSLPLPRNHRLTENLPPAPARPGPASVAGRPRALPQRVAARGRAQQCRALAQAPRAAGHALLAPSCSALQAARRARLPAAPLQGS